MRERECERKLYIESKSLRYIKQEKKKERERERKRKEKRERETATEREAKSCIRVVISEYNRGVASEYILLASGRIKEDREIHTERNRK